MKIRGRGRILREWDEEWCSARGTSHLSSHVWKEASAWCLLVDSLNLTALEHALPGFVPKSVVHRAEFGLSPKNMVDIRRVGSVLAQLQATVLFINLSGVDTATREGFPILQSCLEIIEARAVAV